MSCINFNTNYAKIVAFILKFGIIFALYRGIAKLVRHQVLILTFVGSSPATSAIFCLMHCIRHSVKHRIKESDQGSFTDDLISTYRGIAKLVRHQVLILTFVGSSPATSAISKLGQSFVIDPIFLFSLTKIFLVNQDIFYQKTDKVL